MSGLLYLMSVRVFEKMFPMFSGHTKVNIQTAEGSANRAHSFCPHRGTPIPSSDLQDRQADIPPMQRMLGASALP